MMGGYQKLSKENVPETSSSLLI
jgi:hypothetical protein